MFNEEEFEKTANQDDGGDWLCEQGPEWFSLSDDAGEIEIPGVTAAIRPRQRRQPPTLDALRAWVRHEMAVERVVARWVSYRDIVAEAADRVSAAEKRLRALEDAAVGHLKENIETTPGVMVDGADVRLSLTVRPRLAPGVPGDVIEELDKALGGHLAKLSINAQTLGARVRENWSDAVGLVAVPEKWRETVLIYDDYRLRVTRKDPSTAQRALKG